MVTGFEPIRLPCEGLHESYGVCIQGQHKRTAPVNSQRCKKHQESFSSSLVTQVGNCVQADGGHLKQLA